MIIFPAIDIIDGKCVRLKQGKFDEVTVFSDEPFQVAKRWEDCGAHFLHVVDLDGAKKGAGFNHDVIRKIANTVDIPIQVGGGIRTMQDIDDKLHLGVARVILGTIAITNPDFVAEAVDLFGERIAVGIDAKNGYVATHGWQQTSEVRAVDLCLKMKDIGVKTIIYTDIAKDGMMQGPNIESTNEIIQQTKMNIVLSGGISCMEDLEKAAQIGAYGAITGKAILEGALDLTLAIERFEGK